MRIIKRNWSQLTYGEKELIQVSLFVIGSIVGFFSIAYLSAKFGFAVFIFLFALCFIGFITYPLQAFFREK